LYDHWVAEANTYGLCAPNAAELTRWLSDILLVVEVTLCVVGFAHGVLKTNDRPFAVFPPEAACVDVEDLYVMPEHRRQGIGSQRLQALLDVSYGRAIQRSHVFSGAKDQSGILRFYERNGYTAWGIQLFK
jgi:GNAT superfamily N-acetyltransferase